MLPLDALDRLQRFGAELDGLLPGVLTGIYAVGSLALGDYTPPLSNLDVLAVADVAWPAAQLRTARRAARQLAHRHQPPRVGWVTWADLAEGPGEAATCFYGSRAIPSDDLLNPLTWQILRTAAVCARGPEYPELWNGDLRAWAAARLAGHWAGWARDAPQRPGSLWLRRSTTEAVLEATRLVVALRSGRVTSKLEAGGSSVDGATSRSQRILKDAVGYRSGASMSMYWGPFERKTDAVFHVRECVDEAVGAAR